MDAGAGGKEAVLESGRSDRVHLLLLLALILPLRAWLLYNTEVAARDSIGFIRYALYFESKSFPDAVRDSVQHPGYSIAIHLVSLPVRAFYGDADPYVMRFSAQLVSALAALLLIVPMYFLGKELFGPRVAFWGTLLFQYLPVSGQHLSDGVSEALFLLFVATSLWQGVWGMRLAAEGNTRLSTCLAFSLCGLFSGLAYWTRPEGAFVVAAAGLTILVRQVFVHRIQWTRFALHAACLAAPAIAFAGAFYAITGALTQKPSTRLVVGTMELTDADSVDGPPVSSSSRFIQLPGNALLASTFGAFIRKADDYPTRFRRAGQTYVMELVQGFHYVGIAFVVLGVVWFGSQCVRVPGFWILITYALLQSITLILLATRAFYISDRHMMVLILPGCFFMAAGLLELGRRVQAGFSRSRLSGAMKASIPFLVVGVMFACCLPKTLQRVHGNRKGNHEAGIWLASHLKDGDLVLDDHAWSHYYAGQVFVEGKEPFVSPDYQPRCFVVITRSRIQEVDDVRKTEERKLAESGARPVYHWPDHTELARARVVVYERPREFASHPWKIAALKH